MKSPSKTELEKNKSKYLFQLLRKIGDGLAMQYDEKENLKKLPR